MYDTEKVAHLAWACVAALFIICFSGTITICTIQDEQVKASCASSPGCNIDGSTDRITHR